MIMIKMLVLCAAAIPPVSLYLVLYLQKKCQASTLQNRYSMLIACAGAGGPFAAGTVVGDCRQQALLGLVRLHHQSLVP
jgi:hypothetical protein